jgi:WD40-like Beta Propeller Repeat
MLALSVAPVRAAVKHDYLSQITEVPPGSGAPLPGRLSGLGPITVDSGHLWSVDNAKGVFHVNKFDAATGAFVAQFPQVPMASGLQSVGLGVAVSHGNVYLGAVDTGAAGERRVGVFNEAGALQATWTGAATPAGSFGPFEVDVAVDRSAAGLARGSVYVLSRSNKVVDAFAPEGAGKEPPVSEPSAEHEQVKVLKGTCPVEGTSCEPLEVIPFRIPSHVAVDDFTGNVLVLDAIEEEVDGETVNRPVVDVFEPAALGGFVFLRQIKLPLTLNATALGVDGVSGEIYVAGQGEVDQFSTIGVLLGRVLGEGTPTGDLRSPSSIAVDPVSHHVFVGDQREEVVPSQPSVIDVFGGDLVIPDVATGFASNVTPHSARLNGTVKLDKEGEATCQFVWGTTKEFGQTAPCSKTVTEEEGAVQAPLTGLEPDTTYYYRLQATNKNGLNRGEPSQNQQFTTSGPGIHDESVSNVAATSVTFIAAINPHNAPTTSYFQYGTTSTYGTNVPAAPGLPLGSGESDVETTQHVQGLAAGIVYHYRVVTISEPSPGAFEEFDGPDRTFTTQTAGGFALPDGRSWEMVSPPDKHGALIGAIGEQGLIQASINGDAITYITDAPTEAEPQGYTNHLQVLSTRGGDDWASRDIAIPHTVATGVSVGFGFEYRFFSEDLSLSVVQPFGSFNPSLSEEASEQTAYLRTDYLNGNVNDPCVERCYRPFVTGKPGFANVSPGTVFGEEGRCPSLLYCGPEFSGATPDLSHVVLRSSGLSASGGAEQEWFAGKLTSAPGVGVPGARDGISNDGTRIVSPGMPETGIFMRDVSMKEMVRFDTIQGGTGSGQVAPEFQVASSDGSKVFFTDTQRLTNDSGAQGDERDLYECEMVEVAGKLTCSLSDLTPLTSGVSANVMPFVLGASKDGSYIYFVADSVLAPGAVAGTCQRQGDSGAKACNLYMRHSGTTKLVAVLSGADYPDFSPFFSLQSLTARVSPDGHWLAFMSQRELTGYDTRDAITGKPDEEVYLFDASSGRVVCASCNPSGARPVGVEYRNLNNKLVGGDRVWDDSTGIAANIPGWTPYADRPALYQSRYLADSGRLFFNSSDVLVPQDVNGTEDVYQYEPPGVGGCTTSTVIFSDRSDGCVGLISSGSSAEESAFLDASGDGGDVFFLTQAKLSPQDFDSSIDVYDAHECSGVAPCFAAPAVEPPPCSTGDSCKPAPSPQPPVFGSPSSATFSGAGNVTQSAPVSVVKGRSLTRRQRLARALRACQRKKRVRQRVSCRRQARARYSVDRSLKATTKLGRG